MVNYWQQNIGSKETAMPTSRFERITLAQILVGGCAVVFGLIEFAQAQPGYVPPPTPLPPPVLNPSNPGTVPQPSYRPITPSTPSTVPSIRRLVQPLDLIDGQRAMSIITIEGATLAWDPRWGLLIAATVGVFVFLLRMPITGHMPGIAIEARRITANINCP